MSCSVDQVSTAFESAKNSASSLAHAALGDAFSLSETLTKDSVTNNINGECYASTENMQTLASDITCLYSKKATFNTVQTANAETRCSLTALSKLVNTAASKSGSGASGWDVIADLSGFMKVLVWGAIGLAIVGILALIIKLSMEERRPRQ